MSPLICFPNKLERPGSGVSGEFAFAGDGWQPAEDGAAGEGIDLAGASENEAVGECGKRLSNSLWASEDLVLSTEMRRDELASRGSPEWSGTADSQRAISLDASECLAEISNPALVRSTALEDLRAIGNRSSWPHEGEELICEETTEGDISISCKTASPETQQPPCSAHLFEPDSEDLHPEDHWRNISQKGSLSNQPLSALATVNGISDSPKPDICDDSDTRSGVVQTAQLQKLAPQSSSARKSLVPVPVVKGLFAVTLTS